MSCLYRVSVNANGTQNDLFLPMPWSANFEITTKILLNQAIIACILKSPALDAQRLVKWVQNYFSLYYSTIISASLEKQQDEYVGVER